MFYLVGYFMGLGASVIGRTQSQPPTKPRLVFSQGRWYCGIGVVPCPGSGIIKYSAGRPPAYGDSPFDAFYNWSAK